MPDLHHDDAQWGDLAVLLREDRPEPGPVFAHRMDKLVERGFQGWSPPLRMQKKPWWRPLMSGPALGTALTAMLVALVIALPNNSDEGGGGGSASSGGSNAETATAPNASDSAGGGSGEERQSGGGDASVQSGVSPSSVAPPPGPGSPSSDRARSRKVERSASITLATRPRDIDKVSKAIQAETKAARGFVVSASVSASRFGGNGDFELRVPTAGLDDFMGRLARLAAVRERADRSQDITAQAVSARKQLTDARAERTSLLRQLEDAVTLTETEAVRARLKLVSREIEAAKAGVRRIQNRADFSTVRVTLVADASAVPPSDSDDDGGWSPADAARDALRVLEVTAGVLLIGLAVLGPLALLALLVAGSARWSTRRRRERALDAV
jgi:Domain of unknown function (DUF4349)